MSEWKKIFRNALAAPFWSFPSFGRLILGSVPSMAFWWVKASNSASPVLLAATFLLCFGSAGYSVRVIRAAQAARSANNSSFELPTWRGNPGDMLRALVAGLIGVLAVTAPVVMAITGLLELLTYLLTGELVFSPETAMQLFPKIQANGGDVVSLTTLPAFALLIGVVLFVPVMMVHFAGRDRICAVFEWRTILAMVKTNFWSLLPIVLGAIVVVAIFNAAFHSNFIALSIIGFAADVIVWSLVALICSGAPPLHPGQPTSNASLVGA